MHTDLLVKHGLTPEAVPSLASSLERSWVDFLLGFCGQSGVCFLHKRSDCYRNSRLGGVPALPQTRVLVCSSSLVVLAKHLLTFLAWSVICLLNSKVQFPDKDLLLLIDKTALQKSVGRWSAHKVLVHNQLCSLQMHFKHRLDKVKCGTYCLWPKMPSVLPFCP